MLQPCAIRQFNSPCASRRYLPSPARHRNNIRHEPNDDCRALKIFVRFFSIFFGVHDNNNIMRANINGLSIKRFGIIAGYYVTQVPTAIIIIHIIHVTYVRWFRRRAGSFTFYFFFSLSDKFGPELSHF